MQIQINNEVQLGQGGFGSVFQGMYQHPNIVKLFHVECHNKFK